MNRIFSVALISILLTVLFSCKKNSGLRTGGTITATVNGVTYTSGSVNAEPQATGTHCFIISSTDGGKTTGIVLYIDSLAAGKYSYNTGSANALQYNKGGLTYGTVPGDTGSIIITSANVATNTITGTFSGLVKGLDTSAAVTITNGMFTNCAY